MFYVSYIDFPILTIRPSSVTVNMTESATLQCKGEALEAPSTEWFRLTGEGALDVKSDDRVIVTTDGEMIIQVGDLPCCQFKILTVLCKYWPAVIVLNF